jgi:hypothetical protein
MKILVVKPGQFKIQETIKKGFGIMKNLYNSKLKKKLANNLLKKIILLQSMQNTVTCHKLPFNVV